MSLEQYLETLADNERSVSSADLMNLSAITQEGMGVLRDIWPDIDDERREDVLNKLINLSEDNLDADFSDLFRFCLSDENPVVRSKAIEGLWECDDRTLVTPLINLLIQDPYDNVRATAAAALGKFATLSQNGKMLDKDGEKIKEILMQTIQNSPDGHEIRRRAIEAVAPFNTSDVQQTIQKAYESNQMEVRCSAVYAMGRSCDIRWLPVILTELRSDHSPMRYEASNACGELGEEPAVPHLIPLFEDDDHQIQISAISAVGAIGGSLARKALIHCLKSSDDLVVEAAQEALHNLESIDESMGFASDSYTRIPRSPF